MAQTTITVGMTGAQFRSGLNDNYGELYTDKDALELFNTTNFVVKLGAGGAGTEQYGFGRLALARSTGNYSIGIGVAAGAGAAENCTGAENIAIGVYSLGSYTTGSMLIGIGSNALKNVTTGNYSIGIGYAAGRSITTGGLNVAIGYNSMYNGNGTGNICIGYRSGEYETGSYKLFIDSQDRHNEAEARTNSLIYGIAAATPSASRLYLNALVCMPEWTGAITDGTPSDAEIDTIMGAGAASWRAGTRVVIKDSGGTGLLYLVESDGTDWYYVALTKAV